MLPCCRTNYSAKSFDPNAPWRFPVAIYRSEISPFSYSYIMVELDGSGYMNFGTGTMSCGNPCYITGYWEISGDTLIVKPLMDFMMGKDIGFEYENLPYGVADTTYLPLLEALKEADMQNGKAESWYLIKGNKLIDISEYSFFFPSKPTKPTHYIEYILVEGMPLKPRKK